MSKTFNRGGILWAVGVMQPVSAVELSVYLRSILSAAGAAPSGSDIHKFLIEASDSGQVVRVGREPDLFSLSAQGNDYLTTPQRRMRDKERIFLLRDSWPDRVIESREAFPTGLGGAAPPLSARIVIEGSGANKVGPYVPRVRPYWPRYSKQLLELTGSSGASRDRHLSFLSFETLNQLKVAKGSNEVGSFADFTALGLMLGISPVLINKIAVKPGRHYRAFPLRKRGGGERIIQAPRVFLKVIQKFIADYIICGLPVHPNVHSFLHGRSILSNAQEHARQNWVANIDIEDFFGSITYTSIAKLLAANGFDEASCRAVSRLSTLNGQLPQGAPSSPIISNAILYEFDLEISNFSKMKNVQYTRYADDMSFSGASRSEVIKCIEKAEELLLRNSGLRVNKEKTRINSRGSQQRVTGVVVNEVPLPPRKLRRGIRAAAFNAQRQEVCDQKTIAMLNGYLNYFKSFPAFADNIECANLDKMTKSASDSHRRREM